MSNMGQTKKGRGYGQLGRDRKGKQRKWPQEKSTVCRAGLLRSNYVERARARADLCSCAVKESRVHPQRVLVDPQEIAGVPED